MTVNVNNGPQWLATSLRIRGRTVNMAPRKHVIATRLTRAERTLVEAAAAVEGLSLSDYLRTSILDPLRRAEVTPGEATPPPEVPPDLHPKP